MNVLKNMFVCATGVFMCVHVCVLLKCDMCDVCIYMYADVYMDTCMSSYVCMHVCVFLCLL